MPSAAARLLNLGIRLAMRRRNWGDERALVRRARRLFGSPPPLSPLWTRGVDIVPLEGAVRGEWIVPPAAEPGVVLFFHGGGFVAGGPDDHRPITAGLARRMRRRVFAPRYRLAPEHRYPAAFDDALAAYRWLMDQGEPPIAVAGDSAGGGLVLGTLLRARDARLPLPARAVCLSPWTDLSASGDSIASMAGRCHLFRPENIPAFAAVVLGDAQPDDPGASPLFAELSGLPPILFQVGSTELLLDDARRAHRKIIAAGGQSTLVVFDDIVHGWHLLDGWVPEATAALDQAARFLTHGEVAATPHNEEIDHG